MPSTLPSSPFVSCRCGARVQVAVIKSFVCCDECDFKNRAFMLQLSDLFPRWSFPRIFFRRMALRSNTNDGETRDFVSSKKPAVGDFEDVVDEVGALADIVDALYAASAQGGAVRESGAS